MDQPDGTYAYKAFISYSHKDTAWAKWLLQALEGYRLPAYLKGSVGRRRGVGRIFRDRDEAGAASDLKDEIQGALSSSEHLIIVASPHSARSRYVEAEIEAFAERNARRAVPGHILTLIVEGEPNITPQGSAPAEAECFPLALRGGLRKPDGTPIEPLAADARHTGDGKTRALAKLVSGLLDVRYDALVRRDLQRRRRAQGLVAAAVAAALAIAGVVAAVVVSGNLEQERLRLAQQGAERDARTVAAVNDAERARRLLSAGNVDAALALARKSLPNDGSLPFIPQAYSVLYAALFQKGEPLALELGDWSTVPPKTVPLGDGTYLTAAEMGAASIWSPTTGITFRRNDLDNNSFLVRSPDGTAVFMKTLFKTLRYWPAQKRWDQIDFNDVELTAGGNTDYVALDNHTLVGCGDHAAVGVALPSTGDGQAAVSWTVPIGDGDCGSDALSDIGTILIGTWSGEVVEVDPAKQAIVGRYQTGSSKWIRHVDSFPERVVAEGADDTFVFARSGGPPQLTVKTEYGQSLSPDGRYLAQIVFEDAEHPKNSLVVHNLDDGTSKTADCSCQIAGFLDDKTVLVRSDGVVSGYDAATGTPTGDVYTFTGTLDGVAYFPDSATLLGIRQNSASSAVRLGKKSADSQFLSGSRSTYDDLRRAIFVGDGNILTDTTDLTSGPPYVTTLRLYRRGEDGGAMEIVNPELNGLAHGFVELRSLGPLFGVFQPSSMGSSGSFAFFDAATGAPIDMPNLTAPPVPLGTNRYWLLSETTGLLLFDSVNRTTVPLVPASDAGGDPPEWAATADGLVVLADGKLTMFDLTPDGAANRRNLAGTALSKGICLTADDKTLFSFGTDDTSLLLRSADLATGKTTNATVEIDDTATDPLGTLASDIAVLDAKASECSTDRLVLYDVGDVALVWRTATGKVDAEPLNSLSDPVDPDAPVPDVSRLRTASVVIDNQTIHLRDDAAHRDLQTITADSARVSAARYIPDRGLLAAGLEDGELEVWDVSNPSSPMIDLVAQGADANIIDLDPTQSRLLTADKSGAVRIWPLLTPAELLARTAVAP